MLKKLMSVLTSLCLCLIVFVNVVHAKDHSSPNSADSYITDKHLTIEDVIPENMDYELLSDQDLKKNSKAQKIAEDIKTKTLEVNDEENVVFESIQIYKLKPKKTASISEKDQDCTTESIELLASCNYSSALEYIAVAELFTPYKVGDSTLRQHLKAWWNVYNPPSGRVGNFYKSSSMEVWWTRDSSSFTVKNAEMFVDIQATSWCGGTISKTYPNDGNPWTSPGWETSTRSYKWIWNSSTLDVSPVNSTGTTWVQAYVRADIYHNGALVKSRLMTKTEPGGL